MFQRKAVMATAVIALAIGISIGIYAARHWLANSNTHTPAGPAGTAQATPKIIRSNMIGLEYLQLFQLDIAKTGGGIGATDDELIVVTGDGQLHTVDLATSAHQPSAIQLPANNQQAALNAARQIELPERAEQADREVKKWLRYDDILVFDDKESRHLILSYAHFAPDKACFSHRVSLVSFSLPARMAELEASADDWQLIFSSEPCFPYNENRHAYAGVQSGGRMDLLNRDTGDIVLALGDYEFDGFKIERYPQQPGADYGKILKLNIHSGDKEIISIGHRNTQGITVDAQGRIWNVEQGPQGGDELNLVVKGENYGWPDETLGILYMTRPWPLNENQGRHENFVPPAYAWVPSVATSNIDQSINFHPFWEGDLLVFSLKGQSIFRIRLHDDRVIMIEPIPFLNERIRYGMNHPSSGALFLWTDSGTLYQLTPSEQAWKLVERGRKAYAAIQQGLEMPESATPEILGECLECHSGGGNSAPDLSGIIGRKIGGSSYANYSPALAGRNQTWDEKSLKAYLKSPQNFAPGTTMPDPMISADYTLDAIIDALRKLPAADAAETSQRNSE